MKYKSGTIQNLESDKLRPVVTPFLYYFLHSAYRICTCLVYILVYWYKLPVSAWNAAQAELCHY